MKLVNTGKFGLDFLKNRGFGYTTSNLKNGCSF